LSEFRDRLIAGTLGLHLLDAMLARCKSLGLLKARGRQRTDSTHVRAAVRALNRLQIVGETLRHTLNVLASAAPQWLRPQRHAHFPARYGPRFDEYRLPRAKDERQALAEQIGADGRELLLASDALVTGQQQGIDLVGPVTTNQHWQQRAQEGFAIASFALDWEQQVARCPNGQQNCKWSPTDATRGSPFRERRVQCVSVGARVHTRRRDHGN
jgi:hypothetical protein